jgi:hypothetical protein
MRPKENIEEFVKAGKPDVTTSRQMDKRTLDDSLAAMEQTIRAKSAPSTARIITLGRMIKLTAAAAVIILAVSFFSIHQDPGKQERPSIADIKKSPVEMMTAISLERAFRRGGIEAVEEQCKQAFKPIGPRPESLPIEWILAEFNGNGKSSERTRP